MLEELIVKSPKEFDFNSSISSLDSSVISSQARALHSLSEQLGPEHISVGGFTPNTIALHFTQPVSGDEISIPKEVRDLELQHLVYLGIVPMVVAHGHQRNKSEKNEFPHIDIMPSIWDIAVNLDQQYPYGMPANLIAAENTAYLLLTTAQTQKFSRTDIEIWVAKELQERKAYEDNLLKAIDEARSKRHYSHYDVEEVFRSLLSEYKYNSLLRICSERYIALFTNKSSTSDFIRQV